MRQPEARDLGRDHRRESFDETPGIRGVHRQEVCRLKVGEVFQRSLFYDRRAGSRVAAKREKILLQPPESPVCLTGRPFARHPQTTTIAMQALLNFIYTLLPVPEGTQPIELVPAVLMIAGFLAVCLFGFAMSLYDSWKEHQR